MEEKYNLIRSLQKEINQLFESIEKNKQIIDSDKLIILNQLLEIFNKNKLNIIDDLFNVDLNINEDETIERLNSLKKILKIILDIEQNIKENKYPLKMKRKDLYKYIKEEIVEALSETTYAGAGAVDKIQKDPKFNTLKPDAKTNAIGDLKKGGDVELEEMANIASAIKIQDPAKFAIAKEIYTGGKTAAVLAAIEEAGDEGLTQKQLGEKLGIQNDSELNPIIANLRAAGVVTGKREKMVKPEKPTPEIEPEMPELEPDEEPVDSKEKPEEEEPSSEEEPASVSDKEVEKVVGKMYADLSPEEEKLFDTYKTAIINKAKVLNDKKSSKEDKVKAKASLDNYKTKEDIKKIFAKKGLKLIDFINSELNK